MGARLHAVVGRSRADGVVAAQTVAPVLLVETHHAAADAQPGQVHPLQYGHASQEVLKVAEPEARIGFWKWARPRQDAPHGHAVKRNLFQRAAVRSQETRHVLPADEHVR